MTDFLQVDPLNPQSIEYKFSNANFASGGFGEADSGMGESDTAGGASGGSFGEAAGGGGGVGMYGYGGFAGLGIGNPGSYGYAGSTLGAPGSDYGSYGGFGGFSPSFSPDRFSLMNSRSLLGNITSNQPSSGFSIGGFGNVGLNDITGFSGFGLGVNDGTLGNALDAQQRAQALKGFVGKYGPAFSKGLAAVNPVAGLLAGLATKGYSNSSSNLSDFVDLSPSSTMDFSGQNSSSVGSTGGGSVDSVGGTGAGGMQTNTVGQVAGVGTTGSTGGTGTTGSTDNTGSNTMPNGALDFTGLSPLQAQQLATNKSIEMYQDMYNKAQQGLNPYLGLGQNAATGMGQFIPQNGMLSPDLQNIESIANKMAGLGNQFSLNNLPNAQVGQAFNPQQVNQQFTQGQVGQNFNQGQVSPTVNANQNSAVNQQFRDGYVDPNVRVDLETLQNDPIYQFITDQGRKAALRGLSSQGLTESRVGLDTLSDVAMRAAANEVDRYYGRAVDQNNRMIGNEQRGFQSEQTQANLSLANLGNQLATQQAAYGQQADNAARMFAAQQAQANLGGQNASRMLQSQQLQSALASDNAARDWQAQVANYGRANDIYNNQYNQSLLNYQNQIDNYGRAYGAMGDQINSLANIYGTQYDRLGGMTDLGYRGAAANALTGSDYARSYSDLVTGMANANASNQLSNSAISAQKSADKNAMWGNIAGSVLGALF